MADNTPPPASLPPVPTTYRERLAQFKILEEKRFELIEVQGLLVDFSSVLLEGVLTVMTR
jgi:hypothetical protein